MMRLAVPLLGWIPPPLGSSPIFSLKTVVACAKSFTPMMTWSSAVNIVVSSVSSLSVLDLKVQDDRKGRPIGIKLRTSPSNAVGARVVGGGCVGLYGRPPVGMGAGGTGRGRP